MSETRSDRLWRQQVELAEEGHVAQAAEIARLREALKQSELDMVAALANHEACRDIWTDRAEAMRAKCEAIARSWDECHDTVGSTVAERIADEIAALKGSPALDPTVVREALL